MIDLETLNRNLADCIQQFPMTARHKGREFQVWQNATSDMVQAIEAGTRDNMSIQIIAPRAKFADDRLPKSMDDFMLLQSHGRWVTFQVRDVPDYFDSLSPVLTINLQSPEKGIE
jgi:hypothetical protein